MSEGRSSQKGITTIIRADRHKGQLPILGVSRDRPLPLSLINAESTSPEAITHYKKSPSASQLSYSYAH